MKLTKINIKNFRLLTDVELDIDDSMTLIVGKNNFGKTSANQSFLGSRILGTILWSKS